jgi:hypothetical protein
MFDDGKIDAETRDAAFMVALITTNSKKQQAQADFEKGLLGSAYDWVN